ncbi:hypothetical protein ACEWY4_024668 [Coilia grayii]|uniref:Fibronectin type-III domain-containing protein n=1 Tax=Coilia grayii TaxID=363190 RepID=A0ABD1IWE1_9TELE
MLSVHLWSAISQRHWDSICNTVVHHCVVRAPFEYLVRPLHAHREPQGGEQAQSRTGTGMQMGFTCSHLSHQTPLRASSDSTAHVYQCTSAAATHIYSALFWAPPGVLQVNLITRSETHLQLEWSKVSNNNNYNYTLRFSNGTESSITGPDGGTTVIHTVSSLSPGTKYSFTLFTVFEGVRSTGFDFQYVTAPPDVTQVNLITRSETHLQLEWSKVSNNNNYKYTLRFSNGTENSITGPDGGTTVTHTVSSLSPGTKYSFTLFTVFEGVRSTGFDFQYVTAPPDVTQVNLITRPETHLQLEWSKVSNNNNYKYTLRFSNGTENSITGPDGGTTVTHTVSSLSPGTKYSFTLFTVFEGVRSTGFDFQYVTAPPDVTQVNLITRSETHLQLEWSKVSNNNNYKYTLRFSNGTENSITGPDGGTTVTHTVSSLSPGTKYSFTLFTVFEGVRSTGFDFQYVTAPPDVTQVNLITRPETHLQLEWSKVSNNNNYKYTLRFSNGTENSITGPDGGTTVTHTVSSLSPGTKYSFTLFTVFEGVRSTGFDFQYVTAPPDVTQVNLITRSETHLQLEWSKVSNNNNYKYTLRFSNGTENSITGPDGGTTVTHTVSSLSPGTKYSFTLFTVFEGVRSTGFDFQYVTAPPDVTQVNLITRPETHLQLEWSKVSNNNNYKYTLRFSNGTENSITGPDGGTTVTHTVSSLSPGTKYSFTLFTVFEGVRSTGFDFQYVTAPPDVTQVNLITRSETHLQLEWSKVSNNNNYKYTLRFSNGTESSITGPDGGTTVTHTVSSLSPGTKYSFTLFTVFEGVRSTGFDFQYVTAPPDVTQVNLITRPETHLQLEWSKVSNNNNYKYTLRFSNGTENSITGPDGGTTVTHTVSSLSPGTKYSFTLFTVFEGVRSTGFDFQYVTAPPDVTQVNLITRSETHLQLEWSKVSNNNNYKYTLRFSNGTENSITGPDGGTTVTHTVSSLSPGTKYSFTLFTVFEGVRSTGFDFQYVTAPPDVTQVNLITRPETHLQLEWSKVSNNNNYKYTLRFSNGTENSITGPDGGTTVTHTVSSLSPGTKYSFTLFTVFEGVRSTGFDFQYVTAPPDVTQVNLITRSETHLQLEWSKVSNNNNYKYTLRFSNGTESSITGPDGGTTVTHTVSSLSPGTKYSFTLFTVFEGVRSTGFDFQYVTAPPDVLQVNLITRSETHLQLEWSKVSNNNNSKYTLRFSNGTESSITGPDGGTTVTHTVSSLSPGTKYSFTLFTVFEGVRSTGFDFQYVTGLFLHVHLIPKKYKTMYVHAS